MEKLIIYCKSFSRDVNRTKNLLESVVEFNKSSIPFYISVPKSDINLFKNELGTEGYTLICDEDIIQSSDNESWISQQIVKSSFWKLELCDNYMMIDSDSYFIKDFLLNDFLFDINQSIPYTVIHELRDLFCWRYNVNGHDIQRGWENIVKPIMDIFKRKGKFYDFGPGPVIWSSKVWKAFESKILIPNSLSFKDLINRHPSEFTWYGEFLLLDKTIPLYPCEPIFKFFHYSQQYYDYLNMGYTTNDWKRNYFGIVMQSNQQLPIKYEHYSNRK